MKNSITKSVRRSLACAISAAVLFNATQTFADDVDAGDTYNQSVPTGGTQRDHGISQPSSFGDTSDDLTTQQNRTTSNDAAKPNDPTNSNSVTQSNGASSPSDMTIDQSGMANDDMNQSGDMSRRGTLVNSADGSRQIQISTGNDQLQAVVAESLVDRKIVNLQNKEIGEVEEVVQAQTGGVAALVVEAGGFMGIGEKEVLVPLDEVRLSGNQLIWESQMGPSELKDSQEYRYEEDRYSSVADD